MRLFALLNVLSLADVVGLRARGLQLFGQSQVFAARGANLVLRLLFHDRVDESLVGGRTGGNEARLRSGVGSSRGHAGRKRALADLEGVVVLAGPGVVLVGAVVEGSLFSLRGAEDVLREGREGGVEVGLVLARSGTCAFLSRSSPAVKLLGPPEARSPGNSVENGVVRVLAWAWTRPRGEEAAGGCLDAHAQVSKHLRKLNVRSSSIFLHRVGARAWRTRLVVRGARLQPDRELRSLQRRPEFVRSWPWIEGLLREGVPLGPAYAARIKSTYL